MSRKAREAVRVRGQGEGGEGEREKGGEGLIWGERLSVHRHTLLQRGES